MRFRVQIEQEGARWWEVWHQDVEDPEACARARVARYNAARGPADKRKRAHIVVNI